MKTTLIGILLILFTLLLSSCQGENHSGDNNPTLALLAGGWKANMVMVDNKVVTDAYLNFQLTLGSENIQGANSYTTSGRPMLSPWRDKGSWSFGANTETQIVRDAESDRVNISYTLTAKTLTISFFFAGAGYGGRSESVGGNWLFQFTKM
jgi:hypothetical protein